MGSLGGGRCTSLPPYIMYSIVIDNDNNNTVDDESSQTAGYEVQGWDTVLSIPGFNILWD